MDDREHSLALQIFLFVAAMTVGRNLAREIGLGRMALLRRHGDQTDPCMACVDRVMWLFDL